MLNAEDLDGERVGHVACRERRSEAATVNQMWQHVRCTAGHTGRSDRSQCSNALVRCRVSGRTSGIERQQVRRRWRDRERAREGERENDQRERECEGEVNERERERERGREHE